MCEFLYLNEQYCRTLFVKEKLVYCVCEYFLVWGRGSVFILFMLCDHLAEGF